MSTNEDARSLRHPERISSYFIQEAWPLALVTVSGILYNLGMTVGPYFEGQLVQCLLEIMAGRTTAAAMLRLAAVYLAVILLVQAMRCIKRFYVRRFANDTARTMRGVLYNSLVYRRASAEEDTGALMTKAIADVDACAEGMRKFTTEVFDTGVVMIAYLAMLLAYDWRLTLLACAFTPVAYALAELLKKTVVRYTSASRQSAGRLNAATLSRVEQALTYRVFGCEAARDAHYEQCLTDYEHRAVLANLWEGTLQPLYNVIAMTGVLFILFFGGRNVLGRGWTPWDIAAFTTFLSCFGKLALKASKAAKLFNAVQKARVSWERIRPLMQEAVTLDRTTEMDPSAPAAVAFRGLTFAYPGGAPVLRDVSFTAYPGQIIGITGPVASGKSTLGQVLLAEHPYTGSVTLAGREVSQLTAYERSRLVAYQGHDLQLLSGTIAENVCLGGTKDPAPYLAAVRLTEEIAVMPEGTDTQVGGSGVRLSGGQQARLALARALYAETPVLVLDDPFSAVDKTTEAEIFAYLRQACPRKTILLLSHRLSIFSQTDGVLWVEDGRVEATTHAALLVQDTLYARMVRAQTAGGDLDEA